MGLKDQNEAYEALKGITYDEEPPESLAVYFKDKGNAAFKKGKAHLKEARTEYEV